MARRTFSEGTYRRDPRFRALCRALRSCRSEEEIADLLRDVGTLSELYAWSERFDVARRIVAGQTYRAIAGIGKTSTATVTRVADFLYNGAGGYQRALASQHHHAFSPVRGEDGVVRRARK